MGNSSSTAPVASRRRSPRASRHDVESPARNRPRLEERSVMRSRPRVEAEDYRPRMRSPARPKKQSALPRDPNTGRYLSRGQRASSPSRQTKREKVAAPVARKQSPRRKLEVASPRRPRVEIEEQESASRSRVTFVEKPRRQELEPTARGSPILRSSYTRMVESEAPVQTVPSRTQTRARSASPARREQMRSKTSIESPQLPVSRREYASPSLAETSAVDEHQVVIGPSTTRKMRRMAADVDTVEVSPVERLSQSTAAPVKAAAPQSNLEQILFSYMNTA